MQPFADSYVNRIWFPLPELYQELLVLPIAYLDLTLEEFLLPPIDSNG